MKTCKECLTEKPKSDFYSSFSRCKVCLLAEKKRLRDAHRARGVTAAEQSCGVCRERKPAAEFGVNWARPSGLEVACRDCVKARESTGDRRCSSCQELKPPTEFHKGGGWVARECKPCHAARKQAIYRERQAAGVVASESRCTGCGETKPASQFRNNWARSSGLDTRCHTCVSHGNRKMHFDLSPEEYTAKLAEQGGACAICGRQEVGRTRDGRVKALAVDHDHTTGAVRGLLCANCNKGIGNLGDSADRLIAAARYLHRYNDTTKRGAAKRLVEGSGSPN